MIAKNQHALGFILLSCIVLWSCSSKQPTQSNMKTEGVLRGKVTEVSTLPINGAQINIAYDLGASVVGLSHQVKTPFPGFELRQNYPNPYQGVTTFAFALPRSAQIFLEVVHSLYPSSVPITLVNNILPSGQHTIRWNSKSADSTLLTNGSHLYRMRAMVSGEIIFEDEFQLFHNYSDPGIVAKMQPVATADVNGRFTVQHKSTSIGDTVTVTLPEKPDLQEYRVISDSITVFISSPGYKAAKRRLQFRKQDAPEMNVVLERQ